MAARKRRLAEYAKKRDFTQTSEPSGRRTAAGAAARKAAGTKVAAKKAATKKTAPRKATAKQAAAKKSASKKAAPRKAAAKKPAARRTAARQSTPVRRSAKKPTRRPIFVVQHHKASHDHHDFRLEHDGVLLSWAVPKHVPEKFGERRLAIQVEDHPLDYATFQGTIPKGNYGAGTVRTFDIGHYEPEFDIDEGLKEGKLSVTLHGVRLKGDWTLVRMAPRPGESASKPQWLLMRHHQGK